MAHFGIWITFFEIQKNWSPNGEWTNQRRADKYEEVQRVEAKEQRRESSLQRANNPKTVVAELMEKENTSFKQLLIGYYYLNFPSLLYNWETIFYFRI